MFFKLKKLLIKIKLFLLKKIKFIRKIRLNISWHLYKFVKTTLFKLRNDKILIKKINLNKIVFWSYYTLIKF